MMTKDLCPVTGKVETIYFDAVPIKNLSGTNCYLKGIFDRCSAVYNKGINCSFEVCPIYNEFPNNFIR